MRDEGTLWHLERALEAAEAGPLQDISQFVQVADALRPILDNVTGSGGPTRYLPAHLHLFDGEAAFPWGVTVVNGGNRKDRLLFYPPPDVLLDTDDHLSILQMLEYVGIHYNSPDWPAARFGVEVFKAAREYARRSGQTFVSFDWDHTLSIYRIFEPVRKLLRVRMMSKEPPKGLADQALTAVEIPRPDMQEMAFGMMVGFAYEQGLHNLTEWEQYRPQVGVATHTWPDRIGVLANHFVRLLPMFEGLLPGSAESADRFKMGLHAQPSLRSVIHLHDFLSYADRLMQRIRAGGLVGLSDRELAEAEGYFRDRKGHYRKPLGAMAENGWAVDRLTHFDDATVIAADMNAAGGDVRGVLVRQSVSDRLWDVGEIDKVLPLALFVGRDTAIREAAEQLVWGENAGSTSPALLAALGVYPVDPSVNLLMRSVHPAGTVMSAHETPTTLGHFWHGYVRPTHRTKRHIRETMEKVGGLRAIQNERALRQRRPVPSP